MAWRKEDGWGKAWGERRIAKIKKKRENERGRGQLGESAVCLWVLSDRPSEWGLYSLPSYVNGGFSLLAIRHCTERPWQALYEPPARIIPEPTIMRPAGVEGGSGGWGLPCRQWKCSAGHLHWAHIIKTFLIRCIALRLWEVVMPPTEGCDWRKNVRKEDCGYKRAGKRGDWYKELNEGDVGQGYTMWELT